MVLLRSKCIRLVAALAVLVLLAPALPAQDDGRPSLPPEITDLTIDTTAGRTCFGVHVPRAGVWILELVAPVTLWVEPRREGRAADVVAFERPTASLVLDVRKAGDERVCIAAEGEAAGAVRLTSGFVPRLVSKEGDPKEDEPDPDPTP